MQCGSSKTSPCARNQCCYCFSLWMWLSVRFTLMHHGVHGTYIFAKVFGMSLWCSCFGWTFITVLQLYYIVHFGRYFEITFLDSIAEEPWEDKSCIRYIISLSFYKKHIQISYKHLYCAVCESQEHSLPSLSYSHHPMNHYHAVVKLYPNQTVKLLTPKHIHNNDFKDVSQHSHIFK